MGSIDPDAPHDAGRCLLTVPLTHASPLISAVITTRNRCDLVVHAINSALAQDYPRIEVLVVDDASADDTERVVAAYAPRGVRYLKNPRRRGLAAARNLGLEACTGEYVAFLDDDDVWFPAFLSTLCDKARQTRDTCSCWYCGSRVSQRRGRTVTRRAWLGGPLMDCLMMGWVTAVCSSLFATRALRDAGGFDETTGSGVDHDLWMRLGVAGHRIDFVPQALVHISPAMRHAGRMTSDPTGRVRGIEDFMRKWQRPITERLGAAGFRRFRRSYVSRERASVVGKLLDERVPGRLWSSGQLLRAFLENPRKPVSLALAVALLILGKRGVAHLRHIRGRNASAEVVVDLPLAVPGFGRPPAGRRGVETA